VDEGIESIVASVHLRCAAWPIAGVTIKQRPQGLGRVLTGADLLAQGVKPVGIGLPQTAFKGFGLLG
jgi:hypothetical protein